MIYTGSFLELPSSGHQRNCSLWQSVIYIVVEVLNKRQTLNEPFLKWFNPIQRKYGEKAAESDAHATFCEDGHCLLMSYIRADKTQRQDNILQQITWVYTFSSSLKPSLRSVVTLC